MDEAKLRSLIATGENQETEFKREFPKQAWKLAKEITAFATSNDGVILIGVDDDGSVSGVPGADSPEGRRELSSRVEGICRDVVTPSISVNFHFLSIEHKVVFAIQVTKGSSPVHYADGRPYIRQMTMARVATPDEVQQAILKDEILQRIQALEAKGTQGAVAAAIAGQGELATMNFNQLVERLRRRESRRLP